ncbi:RNA-binding protein 12B-like [Discoglossus pictus]
MAVVIRLQGLPVVADSVDIRNFFTGLNIPDGGVHIIGGKLGEAFIIFATDEDARRAMSRTGGVIKKSHVQLFLSSKTEMQNTLKKNRKGGRETKADLKHSGGTPHGEVYKLFQVIKRQINQKEHGNESKHSGFDSGVRYPEYGPSKSNYGQKEKKLSKDEETVYLFLYGLPYSVTVDEIKNFFHDLAVVDIIFQKRQNGSFSGNGYVKFASVKDANSGLLRNSQYIGHRFISIKRSNEVEWIKAGGQIQKTNEPFPKSRSYTPRSGNNYSHSKKQSHSTSPRQRGRSRSPHSKQFYIHIKNLPYSVERQDIKTFLGGPDMADSEIKFLLDKRNNRTRECLVVLQKERQYQKCLDLHGCSFSGRSVYISPITKKLMLELMESSENCTPPESDNSQEKRSFKRNLRDSHSIRRCIYLRNFPFDVSKHEVQKFFEGYCVDEDDIVLLYDNTGLGLGEALVTFPSEQQAVLAESLNRQKFLGTEVLLRRISDEQVKEFDLGLQMDSSYKDPRLSPNYRGEYFGTVQSHEPPIDSSEFSNDLRCQSADFVGALDEFGNPYCNFPEEHEPFGVSDMGSSNIMDYSNAAPIPTQSFGSKQSHATRIEIKNMPFTATVEEILDFFYGYRVVPDSVEIKLTKNGFSTGNATVCFESYNEALAAVNDLNGRPVGRRKVSLRLRE